jgi:hypothetical protein
MAIFTFDDLNEMERDEAEFFGPSDSQLSEEFSPSANSLSFVRDYSCSLSVRKTATLGNVKMHLN